MTRNKRFESLRFILKHLGLTQEDLADRAGCARTTIHNACSGKEIPETLFNSIVYTLECIIEEDYPSSIEEIVKDLRLCAPDIKFHIRT